MPKRKLSPLSTFEWASLSRYIHYISNAAGLIELGSDQVHSLRLSGVSSGVALARKKRTSDILQRNLRALEGFVGEYKEDLSDEEVSVIRSMYRQYQENASTVAEQEKVIVMLRSMVQGNMFDLLGEEDEPVF